MDGIHNAAVNYIYSLPSFQTNITILQHDDYKDWQHLVDNNPLQQQKTAKPPPTPMYMGPRDNVWAALHDYVYTRSDTDTDTDTDTDSHIDTDTDSNADTDTDNNASFADNNKQNTTSPSSTDSARKNKTI